MKPRRARRAKAPLPKAVRRIRAAALATLGVPLVAAVAYGGMAMIATDPAAGFDSIIRKAGFDPVTPPNRLRGPGALYEVNGATFRKVCDANQALIGERLQSSPTQEIDIRLVENLRLSLSAEALERVKAALGAVSVTAVRYKLKDVTFNEIPLEHLYDIQNDLLSRKGCQAAVDRSLAANLKVCQGYAALSATTSYSVEFGREYIVGVEGDTTITERARLAIEEAAGASLKTRSATEFSGEGLYVGIMLDTRCIVPNTATEPSTIAPMPRKEAGLIGRLLVAFWPA